MTHVCPYPQGNPDGAEGDEVTTSAKCDTAQQAGKNGPREKMSPKRPFPCFSLSRPFGERETVAFVCSARRRQHRAGCGARPVWFTPRFLPSCQQAEGRAGEREARDRQLASPPRALRCCGVCRSGQHAERQDAARTPKAGPPCPGPTEKLP